MEARISAVRVELSVKEKDHNKEVEKITALGKAEAEQAQRRSNAQAADLKATISGLEVDLMKVNYLIILYDAGKFTRR